MKKICIMSIIFLLSTVAYASHHLPERYYQSQWSIKHGGITEYRLDDNSRVDILTDDYAIEVDFCSHKIYEAVGQSLYYAYKTHKQPAILLIIENDKPSTIAALKRAKYLCERLRIKLMTIGNGE